MNQQGNIKSEGQNRQNTRLGSQKEKGEIFNQNNLSTCAETNHYKYQKKYNFHIRINQNIDQKKHLSGSKFYQSTNQNEYENRYLSINKDKNKRLDYFTFKDIKEENKEITKTFQKEALNYIDDEEKIKN